MPLRDYVTGVIKNRIVVGSASTVGLIVAAATGISLMTPAYETHDTNGQRTWVMNLAGQSVQSGSITSKTLTAASCDVKGTSTGMLVCGTDATGAGGVSAVGEGLALNSGLITRIRTITGSSLKVSGTLSGSNLVVSGRAGCTFTGTSATGALVCNNTVGDTEMVAEDYGDFTNAGGSDGFTIDTNAVALTTDTTGNYAGGDGEAGNALTGDTATAFFSTGTLEIGIGGTGFSSCTDGGFVTGNGAAALTCNAILSDNQIYIGDGTTEPTATALPECTSTEKIQYTDSGNGLTCVADQDSGAGALRTSTGSLHTLLSNRFVQIQGDTMSGGLLIVSGGNGTLPTISEGVLLEVAGSASGRLLHATYSLSTSGTLIVGGVSTFKANVGVTGTVNATDFTCSDCLSVNDLGANSVDASELVATAVTLGSYGSATAVATFTVDADGRLTTAATTTIAGLGQANITDDALDYVDFQDTMDLDANLALNSAGFTWIFNNDGHAAGDVTIKGDTDNNLFVSDSSADKIGIGTSIPQTKIEIIGTASGRVIRAQDQLLSSGSLVIDGTALLRGTTSGATFLRGGHQMHSQRCASFIVFGSGSNVTVGLSKIKTPISFSGSLVKVYAMHGEAGNGLTTYDLNINGVTRLSTKLTIDANEKCSANLGKSCTDTAANAAVITQPNFGAFEELTIDIDGQAGATAPRQSTIVACFEPDIDGYITY